MTSRCTKAVVTCLLAVALAVGPAAMAMAHDPIFITDDQTTPDTGPFMPDGTISWALYGTVLDAGDTRGFEFDLRDGDELFVSLLIPNIEPEVSLADGDLPIVQLEAPDGSEITIVPELREVFDEPFSQTSYVTLAELREPGQAGRYRGVILGGAPARFSVAIGESEIFFTETERAGDRVSSFLEITEPLTKWYTTPPGGEQDTSQLVEGEAQIDMELLEEAMESGEAQAPEGSLGEIDGETADEESAIDEIADEAEEQALVEETPVDGPSEAVESDGAIDEVADEPATTETASAPITADDGGSSTTWVAPLIIGTVAVVGGGAFLASRKKED